MQSTQSNEFYKTTLKDLLYIFKKSLLTLGFLIKVKAQKGTMQV